MCGVGMNAPMKTLLTRAMATALLSGAVAVTVGAVGAVPVHRATSAATAAPTPQPVSVVVDRDAPLSASDAAPLATPTPEPTETPEPTHDGKPADSTPTASATTAALAAPTPAPTFPPPPVPQPVAHTVFYAYTLPALNAGTATVSIPVPMDKIGDIVFASVALQSPVAWSGSYALESSGNPLATYHGYVAVDQWATAAPYGNLDGTITLTVTSDTAIPAGAQVALLTTWDYFCDNETPAYSVDGCYYETTYGHWNVGDPKP